MSGEDDQVVRPPQRVAARDALEVVVGEEVDLLVRAAEPGDEAEVPVAEAEGNAEVEERALEVDGRARAADVPAVAPAVAVGVEEVVGLPGVRREHDRDLVLAERARAEDERCVADPSVGGVDSQEVEPALCDSGRADLDVVGRAPARRPGELHRRRDCGASRSQVVHGRLREAREREELQLHALRVGRDRHRRRSADRVRPSQEAGLDSLDADDQAARQMVAPRRLVAVDASAAVRAGDDESNEVRAVGRRAGGTPDDHVGSCGQLPARAPDRLHRPAHLVGGDHSHLDGGGAVELEAEQRTVAEAVAVRADRRQPGCVAGERRPTVRDAQAEQPRRACLSGRRDDRADCDPHGKTRYRQAFTHSLQPADPQLT